jgi:hypothetical protein
MKDERVKNENGEPVIARAGIGARCGVLAAATKQFP